MTNRSFHRIAASITAVPLFIIITTGILLQLKKWIPGIQPPNVKGSISLHELQKSGNSFHQNLATVEQIYQAALSVESAEVKGWKDIRTIDIRPSQGVARVRTQSEYEISVDLGTGKVLQAEPRKAGILISFHEGSAFGEFVRFGLFVPAAFVIFTLWVTGLKILINTSFLKRKNAQFPTALKRG